MVKVSIIIPIYGVEKYIEKCAHSLFSQTMNENIEFIFINDMTKDKSLEVLKEVIELYPKRKKQIKILQHDRNRGLAAARNTGLDIASGEYVIHVDSDDYFDKSMATTMYKLANDTDADIVVADYYLTYKNNEKYVQCQISNRKTMIENLIIGGTTETVGRMNWNKMIRKSLYIKHNIRYIEGVNYNEDLVVMVPLCITASKIVKINQAFTHYVQTNYGSYTKKGSLKSAINRMEATTYLEKYLMSNNEDFSEAIKIKRFQDKLGLLIASDGIQQKEFNNMFPELSQEHDLLKKISLHWRFAYKQALKGNLWLFNFIRYINLILKHL